MRCPTPERAFRGGFVLPVFSFWQTVVYREVLPFVTKRKRKVPPFRRGGRRPGLRLFVSCHGTIQKTTRSVDSLIGRPRTAANGWVRDFAPLGCGHLTTAYSGPGGPEQGMDLEILAGEPPLCKGRCRAAAVGLETMPDFPLPGNAVKSPTPQSPSAPAPLAQGSH